MTEVLGYNVNSYDTLDQPSFLTEEIWQGKTLDPALIPAIMKQLEATFHG